MMKKGTKIAIYFVVICISMASVAWLNYGWLENIIIPDRCIYHNGAEPGWLFRIFYCFPYFDGGHPFPSWFNFVFTFAVGGALGWWIARLITKKR
ncbi:MAG: hypothetical protein LBU95_01365 [Rikenellaceae bacterium]|jgi:hypothetical protein|nr:hypothetical protein [Rikenellaceae bacterium]